MAFGASRHPGGRLPVEVTSFVGRSSEMAEVRRLLGRTRMVTLVGPGGVGKTRLALRAARQVADGYRDGVRLVELSGLKSAELLPNAVSEALGLPEQSSRPQVDAVVEHLATRELLLVLDTCEHLVDACALLADLLLPQAPGLTVLATSRQALDVPGEHVLTVPPLPLPPDNGGGALELFAERAAAAMRGFVVTDANRAQAVTLCRRLDGIPLAIELATVRLRALGLDELVRQLTDTFALLTGGRLTTLSRHRTLRTTIGWSHELCTPAERLLWARLSVFAGPFDLAAMRAVCADAELPADQLLGHLISLVDKSVVLRVTESGSRYLLLDTIREYGADWLGANGERDACRRRHLAHYTSLVRRLADRFHTSEQVPLYRALVPGLENLRAALGYALEGEGGEAVALTGVMWAYWACAGKPREAGHWMDRALERAPEPSADRLMTLVWNSTFAMHRGEHTAARHFADEAQELADRLGVPRLVAYARMSRGAVLVYTGEPGAALELLRDAKQTFRRVGDTFGQCFTAFRTALAHTVLGDIPAALDAFTETLGLLGEGSEESYVQGFTLTGAAIAHVVSGDTAAAGRAARRALELQHARDDPFGEAASCGLLAWTAAQEGRHRRAAWLFGATEALYALAGGAPFAGSAKLQALDARFEAATREAIGERRYELLHRQGVALPRPAAVDFAVHDRDALPAASGETPVSTGTDGLTRREREVAALVAEGLSNREIAERLVVSKRTADAHVEHILTKLSFSSRSEIAALVREEQGTQHAP
ncbi:ATP-binding protein [Streptomyces sp. NPDC048172]|uniref:ATP-binding protein n=1 Tax=Streptomyces sp. NPDC048172 TaxID=3365505 RepID=UPI003721B9FE